MGGIKVERFSLVELGMSPQKTVTITFTLAEAKALSACADDGATGIIPDKAACKAYLGGPTGAAAYRRAYDKLTNAINRSREKVS